MRDPVTGNAIIDPAFKRNIAAETAAIAAGVATKAEIEARGGINASGYYGDSYSSKTNLTDAEYAAALAKGGGSAINAATDAKILANTPPEPKPKTGAGSSNLLTGTEINTGTTSELAIDVFRKTIGLFMGEAEMSKAWVDTLYKLSLIHI